MSLCEMLVKSFEFNKNNIALDVDDTKYTYEEIFQQSKNISNILNFLEEESSNVAVLGNRSKDVYLGILASVLSNKPYVPLNSSFPKNRLSYIINFSETKILILCEESISIFENFANDIASIKILVFADQKKLKELKNKFTNHQFYCQEDFLKRDFSELSKNFENNDLLYIMFTSGSTGKPKGVPVSKKNVLSYVNTILEKYSITSEDKLSQSFDISFDLSVHDIFVNFLSGSTLCVIPKEQLFAPLKFIIKKNITVWFSVPSIIMTMYKMRLLRKDIMPSLRISLFCGEALPIDLALKWQKAASNSIIENLYGPTEATIAIFSHSFNKEGSYSFDTVPIGKIFPNNNYLIKDEEGNILGENQEGSLYLSGEQVVSSYFNNIEQSQKSFYKDESDKQWYKTGDLVLELASKELVYIGREDFQLKIGGFRVELEEVEKLVKKEFDISFALALPINLNNNSANGILLLIEGEEKSSKKSKILEICKSYLPVYMVPKDVIFIKEIPLTFNGKIDRKKLMMDYCNEK